MELNVLLYLEINTLKVDGTLAFAMLYLFLQMCLPLFPVGHKRDGHQTAT